MMRPILEQAKGFTLVETMVAIAILLVAISAPLLAAERAAAAAYAARDEITAAYLAQEPVEYVRAMRDDTYLADYHAGAANLSATAWNDFLNGALISSIASCRGHTCALDPTLSMGTGSASAVSVCGSSCGPLYLTSNGIYTERNLGGSTKTTFTRTFTVSDDTSVRDSNNNPISQDVTVTVTWRTDNVPYSVTVSDNLAPWQ